MINKETRNTIKGYLEGFIQGMIEHLDLGPSWDKRLASYVGVTKVENIMNINMDSGTILSRLEEHDYLEFSVDERQNLNPHADIYYAELCTGGDCEQTYCEMISDGMRALGQVVLETYSYDC